MPAPPPRFAPCWMARRGHRCAGQSWRNPSAPCRPLRHPRQDSHPAESGCGHRCAGRVGQYPPALCRQRWHPRQHSHPAGWRRGHRGTGQVGWPYPSGLGQPQDRQQRCRRSQDIARGAKPLLIGSRPAAGFGGGCVAWCAGSPVPLCRWLRARTFTICYNRGARRPHCCCCHYALGAARTIHTSLRLRWPLADAACSRRRRAVRQSGLRWIAMGAALGGAGGIHGLSGTPAAGGLSAPCAQSRE